MTRAAELLESEVPVVAELMTREMGKTFAAAKGEAMKCAATMRYFAEHAEAMLREENLPTKGSRSGVRFDPIGPIFAVMPWNFPWWQVIRMAVPTMMAGNVVVFKHAPNVPGSAQVPRRPLRARGLCAGVLTTVFVEIEQVPDIIADPRIVAVDVDRFGARRAIGRRARGKEPEEVRARAGWLGSVHRRVARLIWSSPCRWRSPRASRTTARRASRRSASSWCANAPRSSSSSTPRRWARSDSATRWIRPPELGPLVSRSQRDLLDAQVASSIDKGAQVARRRLRPRGDRLLLSRDGARRSARGHSRRDARSSSVRCRWSTWRAISPTRCASPTTRRGDSARRSGPRTTPRSTKRSPNSRSARSLRTPWSPR